MSIHVKIKTVEKDQEEFGEIKAFQAKEFAYFSHVLSNLCYVTCRGIEWHSIGKPWGTGI